MSDEGVKEGPDSRELLPSSFLPLPSSPLSRQLGLFGTTMAVMGGIIGAGIFINPYIVAERVQTAPLILGAWIMGGLIALAGGLKRLAQISVLSTHDWHPRRQFGVNELTQWPISDSLVAVGVLAFLTAVNCLGVRAGSRLQSMLTLTAIGAIALLEAVSFWRGGDSQIAWRPLLDRPASMNLVLAFGAAMTPVLFAYGGWQTTSFLGGEVRDPRRTLPRGLILGVLGVIAVYVSVNFVYLSVLGAGGLAHATTPASAVMHQLLGARGGQLIAAGIAISAFGFLAQSMLTAPRVYFAMAEDGVFFRGVAWVHPRTRVPVVAIILQGVWAIVIALAGTYAQVVNYVVAMDCIFFGLTAVCLFVLRRRESAPVTYRVPGHPWTTLLFIAAQWLIVLSTFAHDPKRAFIGLGIALFGLPIYFLWR